MTLEYFADRLEKSRKENALQVPNVEDSSKPWISFVEISISYTLCHTTHSMISIP